MVISGEGWGMENWMKIAKFTNFQFKISKYQECKVQHNKYNQHGCILCRNIIRD